MANPYERLLVKRIYLLDRLEKLLELSIAAAMMITVAAAPNQRRHYGCSRMGRSPVDVAIELDISASEVEELQQEFWALNQLHELGFLFNEIKNYLPSFIKLFNLLKSNKMLGNQYILKFIKFANYELPSLESKIQNLTGDVIELEWKKRDLNNTITLWNAQLRDLGLTMEQYQNAIEIKKQQLMRMDKRVS